MNFLAMETRRRFELLHEEVSGHAEGLFGLISGGFGLGDMLGLSLALGLLCLFESRDGAGVGLVVKLLCLNADVFQHLLLEVERVVLFAQLFAQGFNLLVGLGQCGGVLGIDTGAGLVGLGHAVAQTVEDLLLRVHRLDVFVTALVVFVRDHAVETLDAVLQVAQDFGVEARGHGQLVEDLDDGRFAGLDALENLHLLLARQ